MYKLILSVQNLAFYYDGIDNQDAFWPMVLQKNVY